MNADTLGSSTVCFSSARFCDAVYTRPWENVDDLDLVNDRVTCDCLLTKENGFSHKLITFTNLVTTCVGTVNQ